MDTDLNLLCEFMQHIYPKFTLNHFLVYKLLWQIAPKNWETVIEQSGLCRGTVYKILKELMQEELIQKTNFSPVGYFAIDPVKAYSLKSEKIILKLENGREKIKQLIENSSSLSNEAYLIKKDGCQTKLINVETRETIRDEDELKGIKKAVDERLTEVELGRQKAFAVYR